KGKRPLNRERFQGPEVLRAGRSGDLTRQRKNTRQLIGLNLAHNLGDDYTVPQRKIYREVEKVKEENYGISERERIAGWFKFQSRLNENFVDFFDFVVKKICEASLGSKKLLAYTQVTGLQNCLRLVIRRYLIAEGNYLPTELPRAIPWPGFELPLAVQIFFSVIASG
ncbi:MAG: hypothetical protein LBK44_04490, partial [Spirochaetales bacterium]|nr:hypothetical protein [Spirochaetales bacterium]